MSKQPSDYSEGWGELIRAHRFFMGISQRTLADKLKMGERSLSDIEVGRRSCPPGFLSSVELVADEFDKDVEKAVSYAAKADAGDDGLVPMPVSDAPEKEWQRAVIGRAAVETGTIMPTLIG